MVYRSTMCFSCYRLPVVLQSHVCVRVTALVRRLFSQCSGLIRRGATRLTSDLENRWAPRGDSTSYNNSHNQTARLRAEATKHKTAWTERQRGRYGSQRGSGPFLEKDFSSKKESADRCPSSRKNQFHSRKSAPSSSLFTKFRF